MNNKNMHSSSCSRSCVGIGLLATVLIAIPVMADTVRSAIARVDSKRGTLDTTEQDILLSAIAAYVDVRLAAKLAAIGSERDSILASYALMAAMGHLHTTTLVLPIDSYEPSVHYDAVNRQWFGTRARSAP